MDASCIIRLVLTMDSISIDLLGSTVSQIVVLQNEVRLCFDPAYIVKTMTGSSERTRWYQQGAMVFIKGVVRQELPEFPCVCAGGDIRENIYTYRDMIPLPMNSQGTASCTLKIKNASKLISVSGEGVRLEMIEPAKYIEHIREV